MESLHLNSISRLVFVSFIGISHQELNEKVVCNGSNNLSSLTFFKIKKSASFILKKIFDLVFFQVVNFDLLFFYCKSEIFEIYPSLPNEVPKLIQTISDSAVWKQTEMG